MSKIEIQQGNVGTVVRVNFKTQAGAVLDISSSSTREIIFRSPGGVRLAKAGTFATDGTDGALDYVTESAFLNESSTWRLQGHVVISGQDFSTEIDDFEVLANL